MTDDLDLDLDPMRQEPTVHRWWARRRSGASMVAVLVTHAPELATDNEALQAVANDPASVTEQHLEGSSVLDLCAGSCTIAAAASQIGATTTAIDNHPIAVLIGRATLSYPPKYGYPHSSVRGVGAESKWAGLATEVAHWARLLLERVESGSGPLWLDGIDGVSATFRLGCPTCGHPLPAELSGGPGRGPATRRGPGNCPSCMATFRPSEARRVGSDLELLVRDGEVSELDTKVRTLLTAATYPAAIEPFLDEPFAFSPSGPMSIRDATSPRQAQVIRASQEAVRSIRNDLADAGYAPDRAAAILTYLALGLSPLVDLLSSAAKWSEQRKRPTGLDRNDWYRTFDFLEVGGKWLRSSVNRRFADIDAVIRSHIDGQGVNVRSGDMTAIGEPDTSFDFVIWDPPFYDNIAYDRVALPWTRFLRSTIGDLDPALRWPPDPSLEDLPPSFDRDDFEDGIRRAATEVSRVLRPNGRLGVFWVTRTGKEVADLTDFLDLLEPAGLELVQSLTLATGRGSASNRDDWPKQILLVFRRTPSAQPSDAAAVLAGERAGQKTMVAGLVALLEQHLDDDDITDLIPKDYRGSRSERLAEAVLVEIDPQQFLRRLPKRALKESALERGCSLEDMEALDRDGLASLVFRQLGWRSPQEAAFTVGRALDEVNELSSRLRLARDEGEIRGLATSAFDRIERVLRFAVVTWATRLRDGEWGDCLSEVVGKKAGLTFGQWFGAFRDIPGHYAGEDQILGGANARLRRTKVVPAVEAAVAVRNKMIHPEQSPDWLEWRDEAVTVLGAAVQRLRTAESVGALPRMLEPVSEVRDPYGRITLRLVGHAGHYVEFLMTEPSDLTRPVIVIPGDSNPREVDPTRVDSGAVLDRAGLA